jgi:hypothetical protein
LPEDSARQARESSCRSTDHAGDAQSEGLELQPGISISLIAVSSWGGSAMEIYPEVGDFNDNVSVFMIANHKLKRGTDAAIVQAVYELNVLRHQILTTKEERSMKWLLPRIEELIEKTLMSPPVRPDGSAGAIEVHNSACATSHSAGIKSPFVNELKRNAIEASLALATLSFAQALLVHHVMDLPGLAQSPITANIVAGSALTFVLRAMLHR